MESNSPTDREEAILTDIDGTLTPPREPLVPEMVSALRCLMLPFHVAAGSDLPLIREQFFQPLWKYGYRGEFEAFVSNGASHYHCRYTDQPHIETVNEFDIKAHLGTEGFGLLEDTLEEVIKSSEFALGEKVKIMGKQIVDRGSMVNFAPSGRPVGGANLTEEALANRKAFVEFDKEVRYRESVLAFLRERLAALIANKNLHIMYGGETSFDIVIRGMDKTNAVQCLLDSGIKKIYFVGDALFPGGNDSVIQEWVDGWQGDTECPVEAIPVKGWRDTVSLFEDRQWLSDVEKIA